MAHTIFCPCGRRLHYSNPAIESHVQALVDKLGAETTVICRGARYRVSRHYIALHGLQAADLERLAAEGIIHQEQN